MVYASEQLSLAALETLAHAEKACFERDYVAYRITLPTDLVLELRGEDLPNDWRARPASAGARAVGDAWIDAHASVALRVPSVLVPQEFNLILNPEHAKFGLVRVDAGTKFRFDERL